MSTPASYEDLVGGLYRLNASVLPEGTMWFDAHTHTGQNDPDGMKATGDEILALLDTTGHAQALVFSTMEPDGYPPANDRVIAEAAASGGRLHPLARLDPHDSPVAEAERCLDAGARRAQAPPAGRAVRAARRRGGGHRPGGATSASCRSSSTPGAASRRWAATP